MTASTNANPFYACRFVKCHVFITRLQEFCCDDVDVKHTYYDSDCDSYLSYLLITYTNLQIYTKLITVYKY